MSPTNITGAELFAVETNLAKIATVLYMILSRADGREVKIRCSQQMPEETANGEVLAVFVVLGFE